MSPNAGMFLTHHQVTLTLILPKFSSSMEIQWACAIDENPNSSYDMIIGQDLIAALKWTYHSAWVASHGTE